MKDIKELIYAAVEENALKFQELVNNQLQVRAYDAIEALRPEVGASMFGESSHKKMDDEDEEDMKDMEDEEDEDEKKSKVEEELKGKQHKIDKNKNGKIDAHDFKLLRKEEAEELDESVFDSKDAAQSFVNKLKTKHDDGNYHVKADNGKHRVTHAYYPNSTVKKQIARIKEEAQQIAELSKKTTGSYLKKATQDYADRHGEEGENQGWDDARGDSAWDDSPNEDDREEHEKEREANIKKMGDRNRGINRAIKKLTKEEIEALDELSAGLLDRASKAAQARSDDFKSEKNRIAKMPHQQRDAPEREAKQKTYGQASDHYGELAGKMSRHKSNMADKLKAKSMQSKLPARMKNTSEEVEQIDEIGDTPRGKAALTKLASHRFGRARWAHGVDHYEKRTSSNPPKETAYGKLRDKDNAVAKKAADKAGVAHKDVPNHEYDYSNKGGYGTGPSDPAHKFAARNKVSEEVVNEVAMPKNAADWQALITHQIKTTGHPVATDAQFRAAHGKDKTKIASLEPGEDKLQYATAQGGTVKQ